MAQSPSASEVAAMYSIPVEGMESSNRFYTQLRQQQSQHNDQVKLQKRKQVADYQQDLDKALTPSGTYHDFYSIPATQKAKQELMEWRKANPNASQEEYALFADQKVAPIIAGNQKAKTIGKTIDDLVTQAEKHPTIDRSRLKNDILKSAYYDQEGNIRQIPDDEVLMSPNYDYVNNEDVALKYTDPQALSGVLSKTFKEQFQPFPLTVGGVKDQFGNEANVTHYMNPFQRPTKDNMGVEMDFSPIRIGEKEYPTISAEKIGQLPVSRELMIAQRMERNKLIEQDPRIAELPESVQDNIATAQLIKNYAGVESGKKSEWDYSAAKFSNQKEQQALQNQRAEERLNIARQANARANEKMNAFRKAQKANPYANKYADVVGYVLTNADGEAMSPEATEQMKAFRVDPTPNTMQVALPYLSKDAQAALAFDMNPERASKFVDIHDLSAASPGGYFTDRKTLKTFKSLSVKDKITGENIILRQYISPGETGGMVVDKMEVVKPKDIKAELSGYQKDFRVPEKAYDETFSQLLSDDEE